MIALFAVGRGQPTLFLAGVEVEGLQNVLVCELDVAGALFVKRGGEVVKLDLLALPGLLCGFQGCPEFVAVVLLAVGVQVVQHPLDLRKCAFHAPRRFKPAGPVTKGTAAENDLFADLVSRISTPAVVIVDVL